MRTFVVGLAVGCVALASSVVADTVRMVTVLTGSQETPPVATTGKGCGIFEIDTVANTMRYKIVFWDLMAPEAAAHIHGYVGPAAPAGVVHPLPLGNLKVGVWNYPQANEADILGGRTYVNVHSAMFGGGEIRGQICDMVAMLDGAQETPPVVTGEQGVGLFFVETATNTLRYHIVHNVGGETAAHIHGPGGYGFPAGVVHPLALGSPKNGAWTYPTSMEQQLFDGMFYVNIHTAANPGGRIRGQIVCSVNPMDGTQETPPNATPSVGCTLASLDRLNDRYGYDVRFGLVTGSVEGAAHIHGFAPSGAPAGVVHPLALGNRKLGVWNYPAASEANILANLTYVNIHTNVFGGGEIRGQVHFCDFNPCPADFNGDGSIDFFDYDDFVTCFEGGPCPPGRTGDFNGDGSIDFFDYDDFVIAFELPC